MAHQSGEDVHTDPMPLCVDEELRANHGMLHRIEDADSAGGPIHLLPNGDIGLLWIKLPWCLLAEPPAQATAQGGQRPLPSLVERVTYDSSCPQWV
jgi:hypothetical protein